MKRLKLQNLFLLSLFDVICGIVFIFESFSKAFLKGKKSDHELSYSEPRQARINFPKACAVLLWVDR
jgi:hypothetical protein